MGAYAQRLLDVLPLVAADLVLHKPMRPIAFRPITPTGKPLAGATAGGFGFAPLAMAPPVLSMARGVLRLTAVMELLPEWKQKLLSDGWIWTFLAAVAPLLALWNSVAALFTRQIRWRGIRYKLLSPGQTQILSR